MDLNLMQEHCSKFVVIEDLPVMESDGSNSHLFYCADVVGNKRFAQNFGGYPASEIAELNRATTLEAQMNILNTLNDYSPMDNPNAGLTDAEIMLGHKSKYCQTASEMVTWLDGQLAERDANRYVEQNKSSQQTIDFKNDDSKPLDNE